MKRYSRCLAAIFVGTIGGTALLMPVTLIAEPLGAREEVGKPVEQAERLLRQSKFKEALAALRQAEGVPGKSRYETFIVAETMAAVYLESGNYREAAKPIETALGTELLSKEATQKRLEDLIDADSRVGDDAGVIKYGEQYYSDGGADQMPHRLMADAYFRLKEFGKSAEADQKILDDAAAAGRPPDESLLLLLADAKYQMHDQPGYEYALERLIASDPKPAYWRDLLLTLQRSRSFDDRMTLEIDRLKFATGVFSSPRDYIVMAELALEANLPAEARTILAEGRAARILGVSGNVDRQDRLVAFTDGNVKNAEAGLAQQAKDAAAAPSGEALITLGRTFASFGKYTEAIAAFDQGLAKGGIADSDLAKLDLGITAIDDGQLDKAKAALRSVSGTGITADLARLWIIRADQVSQPSKSASQKG